MLSLSSAFDVPDVSKAIEWTRANASIPEEITAFGKSLGQLGHRFVLADDQLVVIDEWATKEQFDKFFEGAPRMGEFLGGAGITGPPTVSVFESIDGMPGTF